MTAIISQAPAPFGAPGGTTPDGVTAISRERAGRRPLNGWLRNLGAWWADFRSWLWWHTPVRHGALEMRLDELGSPEATQAQLELLQADVGDLQFKLAGVLSIVALLCGCGQPLLAEACEQLLAPTDSTGRERALADVWSYVFREGGMPLPRERQADYRAAAAVQAPRRNLYAVRDGAR